MDRVFEPIRRQSLPHDIARRITKLIHDGGHTFGERLPPISQMARQLGVGSPTLREALKQLETVGVVEIRHGSGVYVGRSPDSLLISNPILDAIPTRKLLVDLIEARIPIELQTAALAARNATAEHLDEMRELLAEAGRSLDDADLLNQVNLSFHRQIALASGNTVVHQVLEVLTSIFREEQRLILSIHGRRDSDHQEHLEIYDAIQARDSDLAVERMRAHLERVRDILQRWEPSEDQAS